MRVEKIKVPLVREKTDVEVESVESLLMVFVAVVDGVTVKVVEGEKVVESVSALCDSPFNSILVMEVERCDAAVWMV